MIEIAIHRVGHFFCRNHFQPHASHILNFWTFRIIETIWLNVGCFIIHLIKCHLVLVNLSPNRQLQHLPKYPKYQIEKLQWEMRDPVHQLLNSHNLRKSICCGLERFVWSWFDENSALSEVPWGNCRTLTVR